MMGNELETRLLVIRALVADIDKYGWGTPQRKDASERFNREWAKLIEEIRRRFA